MWKKKGLIFNVIDYLSDTIISHASIPYCMHLQEDNFRIYFSSRNIDGKSLPYYVDANISDGIISLKGNVIGPILHLGQLGTFDDNGIMPSSFVKHENKVYMYYIGWNPQVNVSYRLSIGLAISLDEGKTFDKFSNGPISDRSVNEPFFNTAPFVIIDDNKWKMWYISCTSWQIINNYPEPSYLIKYTESSDGINWNGERVICIDYDDKAQAIGRPCVIKHNNIYEMYFSFRQIIDYRSKKGNGYQLGFSASENGKDWVKKYSETNIMLSENDWDSNMMEYCHVFNHKNYQYMVYNGNDFGKEGFGYATKYA